MIKPLKFQEPTAVKRVAIGGLATVGFATGARAIAAFAVGAFAIGSFAIRRLAIGNVRIRSLKIEDLQISHLPSQKFPTPEMGFVLTHFLTVSDIKRSARFYSDVLGGEIVFDGAPTIIKIANSWITLNIGGDPTDDKPQTILHPPMSTREVSSFLNIRVSDIHRYYREWKKRGAEFLTKPKDHGRELRCYMKDPDGYIIEVGQSTGFITELKSAA
jgi:catechol 2,3-dioxygenase-like lactoylglutathione lyase family enzyme